MCQLVAGQMKSVAQRSAAQRIVFAYASYRVQLHIASVGKKFQGNLHVKRGRIQTICIRARLDASTGTLQILRNKQTKRSLKGHLTGTLHCMKHRRCCISAFGHLGKDCESKLNWIK